MSNRILLLFALSCTILSAASARAGDSLSAAALRAREAVRYLSSDELQGRAPGGEGNQKAIRFVAERFKEYGLTPLDTSYFQPFSMLAVVRLGAKNSAVVRIAPLPSGKESSKAEKETDAKPGGSSQAKTDKLSKPRKITWTVGKDFIPLGFSEDTATSASVVFVGYGVSVKELNYDDYAGIDAKGKIVVALRGVPEANNPHGAFQKFAPLRSKVLNAREHGAAAILFVHSESESPGADSADVLPALKLDRAGNSGLAAIQITRAALKALLPSGKSLGDIEQKILASKQPASFPLNGVTMTLSTNVERIERPTANVVGFVRGADSSLRDQYVVIGAHCDHLGMGEENSLYAGKDLKIHPGADDNASGTAGMLELAAAIAKKPLRRPALFIAFNGEESGLLGSQYYCKYPKLPLERCAFMLNLDMIGRLKNNALSAHGTGTSSRWEALTDSLAKPRALAVSKSADGYGPSDHSSFYAKNVPVLFLFTGLHDDYHRPSDTWDKLNYEGLATVVGYAEDLVRAADASPAKPDFIKVTTNQVQRSTGFRVYVGTIPDYNDHPKGMKVTGVRAGSPAQKAGLQEGDVVIKIGESRVKNVYDYTYALANFKPGDKTAFVVLRQSAAGAAEQELRFELTFEARK